MTGKHSLGVNSSLSSSFSKRWPCSGGFFIVDRTGLNLLLIAELGAGDSLPFDSVMGYKSSNISGGAEGFLLHFYGYKLAIYKEASVGQGLELYAKIAAEG
jgi:hypothetical protein